MFMCGAPLLFICCIGQLRENGAVSCASWKLKQSVKRESVCTYVGLLGRSSQRRENGAAAPCHSIGLVTNECTLCIS